MILLFFGWCRGDVFGIRGLAGANIQEIVLEVKDAQGTLAPLK